MVKSSLEVNILGTSFTVQAGGDPHHLRRVVDYMADKVREIQQKYTEKTTQDPVKISLLAGLNVVDELLRGRRMEQEEGGGSELERITERLIDTIDRSLIEN
jgi:cell division protein ZapA (FtsZ GTPase activity inhibitor)